MKLDKRKEDRYKLDRNFVLLLVSVDYVRMYVHYKLSNIHLVLISMKDKMFYKEYLTESRSGKPGSL